MQILKQSVDDYIREQEEIGVDYDVIISEVAQQMLDGVQEIHQTKHLHRDIKPDNFRVEGRKVYIIDFGTVKNFLGP